MNRYLLLTSAAAFLLPVFASDAAEVAESPPRLELRADGIVGLIGYQEHPSIAPVDSEWDAPALGLALMLRREVASGLTFSGSFQALQSTEEKEKWTSNGVPIQKNDMKAGMLDYRFEIGKHVKSADALSLHPSVGIGFRTFEFIRDNFVVDGSPADFGEVTEDYGLSYLSTGLELIHHWTPSSGLDIHALAGWIFWAEAENDLVAAKIEGDGGYLLQGSAAWFFHPNKKTTRRFLTGVSVEIQKLDGRVEDFVALRQGVPSFNTVEWPDNEWNVISFFLSWNERF